MDEETRTARQKAIAEKKRRLEEIKARRTTTTASAPSAPPGNLDDYIDELLKSTPAAPVIEEVEKEAVVESVVPVSVEPSSSVEPTEIATSTVVAIPTPSIEKFEVAIQCEEDDFPPPSLIDETEPQQDDDDSNIDSTPPTERLITHEPEPPTTSALTQEERDRLINTPNFTYFISTASKRVERLLGSEEGGWAGVDYVRDSSNDADDSSVRNKKRIPYQHGGFFTGKSTYEFPHWTRGRSITDMEWCPSHPEWILTSYNSRTSNTFTNNPATKHLSPHDPSSSFLSTNNNNNNEGLLAIYNLILPTRPEHIFCAGCPIVTSKFHPTEHPKLVLGGGTSGQLLVWDARVGRYPVQRSGIGHNVTLVDMKILENKNLVSISSDGQIYYWSVSNLREPIEGCKLDRNLSCCDVLTGSGNEGIVVGDERGGLHAVYSAAATAGAGSSSLKRVVRTLDGGALESGGEVEDSGDGREESIGVGHYGMVTSVAARSYMNNSNTPRSSSLAGGTFKGFLRGVGGLVVTTGVDWSTKLWAPAYSDKPLMSFLSNSYDYMCDVQWSPVHPSIFATASSNGTLNLWNLATSLDQPISGSDGIQLDDNPTTSSPDATPNPEGRNGLNRLKWSADGRRLAVASGDQLHVLGVGDDLWKSKGDEESRVMSNLTSRGLIQVDAE